MPDPINLSNQVCPISSHPVPLLELEHGAGGRRFQQLLANTIRPRLGAALQSQLDSAICDVAGGRVAFTTDSYVVKPLFFPGGDIGTLAVFGTVNDLAMVGAVPRYLSCSLIATEGFELTTLDTVLASLAAAADRARVDIVTGDTKIIERTGTPELYINTAGIGEINEEVDIGPHRITAGDAIIVSGPVGQHGAAIMAVREGLDCESGIESDVAPLADVVAALIHAGVTIHALRDATRGGLTAALIELSQSSGLAFTIEESLIPVDPAVAALAKVLGLDPMHLACEGRFVALVAASDAELALSVLSAFPVCRGSVAIGQVAGEKSGRVYAHTVYGSRRTLEWPLGMNLPRIC